jgi:uncharacterized protein
MNMIGIRSLFGKRSFMCRFIFILVFVQLISNALMFLSIRFFFHHPGIPQFRLIGAACQAVTFLVFRAIWKPSLRELGLDWSNVGRSARIGYAAGVFLVLLMVASSYFIMKESALFALATNIQFGITTPILEESLFRGYGWHGLKGESSGDRRTLIVTSVLFGLFHIGYYHQIAYATGFHPDAPPMIEIMAGKVLFGTVLGAVLGLIRWKSNGISGPLIAHAILNIMSR